MKHHILKISLLAIIAIVAACGKNDEPAKPAYDLIPYVFADSTRCEYYINGGYYTKDTFYLLNFSSDSLTMHLKIENTKSGFMRMNLIRNGIRVIKLSNLNTDLDTIISISKEKIPQSVHIYAYHHTAEVSFEIFE
ncbi:MAG: hypothetical protein Q7J34_05055 [Bacteroidales bacterium]|nr:hypothetical protein [Bacteroidales bacterium]